MSNTSYLDPEYLQKELAKLGIYVKNDPLASPSISAPSYSSKYTLNTNPLPASRTGTTPPPVFQYVYKPGASAAPTGAYPDTATGTPSVAPYLTIGGITSDPIKNYMATGNIPVLPDNSGRGHDIPPGTTVQQDPSASGAYIPGTGGFVNSDNKDTTGTSTTGNTTSSESLPDNSGSGNKETNGTGTTGSTTSSESLPDNSGLNYAGTDFLEWFKANYGKDYNGEASLSFQDNMNYYDFLLGLQLFDAYKRQSDLDTYYDDQKSRLESLYGEEGSVKNRNDENYSNALEYQKKLYDSAVSSLERGYGASASALDRDRSVARQNASVMLDKMNKYLPNQVKASGLSGQGVSESTLLSGFAGYNSRMGEIDQSYADNYTSLKNNYLSSRSGLDNQNASALSEYLRDYNQAEDQRVNALDSGITELDKYRLLNTPDTSSALSDILSQKYSESDVSSSNIASQVITNLSTLYEGMIGSDGKISETDFKKLQEYVDSTRSDLGSYAAILDSVLSSYRYYVRSAEDQTKLDDETTRLEKAGFNVMDGYQISGDFKTGDNKNFVITDGVGNPYNVQVGSVVTDSTILSEASGRANGTVFTYGGNIYVYYGGNVYSVEGRTTSNKDYQKLYSALFS